jgi:LPS-assembly lipoprotein
MLIKAMGIKLGLPASRGASALRRTPAWVVLALLAGCGFRLEGSGPLPGVMASIYVETVEPHSDFVDSITNALRDRGSGIVVSPDKASATLTILEDTTGQRVLSVSARNIPREYEVYYQVTFSVQAGSQSLIEPQSLIATRSYTYDETEVLGKSSEEQILRRALADDLARQVVRRLQAAPTIGPKPG